MIKPVLLLLLLCPGGRIGCSIVVLVLLVLWAVRSRVTRHLNGPSISAYPVVLTNCNIWGLSLYSVRAGKVLRLRRVFPIQVVFNLMQPMTLPTHVFKKKTSVVWVHERTIPTEQPLLVGEVSTNFKDRGCHVVSATDFYGRILHFSRPESLLFLPSSSSVVLMRLSGPRSRPTTTKKIRVRRESTRDLWICSQESEH
jgi:hypothetical protein